MLVRFDECLIFLGGWVTFACGVLVKCRSLYDVCKPGGLATKPPTEIPDQTLLRYLFRLRCGALPDFPPGQKVWSSRIRNQTFYRPNSENQGLYVSCLFSAPSIRWRTSCYAATLAKRFWLPDIGCLNYFYIGLRMFNAWISHGFHRQTMRWSNPVLRTSPLFSGGGSSFSMFRICSHSFIYSKAYQELYPPLPQGLRCLQSLFASSSRWAWASAPED